MLFKLPDAAVPTTEITHMSGGTRRVQQRQWCATDNAHRYRTFHVRLTARVKLGYYNFRLENSQSVPNPGSHALRETGFSSRPPIFTSQNKIRSHLEKTAERAESSCATLSRKVPHLSLRSRAHVRHGANFGPPDPRLCALSLRGRRYTWV